MCIMLTFIYNNFRSSCVGDREVVDAALPVETDVTEETEVSFDDYLGVIAQWLAI